MAEGGGLLSAAAAGTLCFATPECKVVHHDQVFGRVVCKGVGEKGHQGEDEEGGHQVEEGAYKWEGVGFGKSFEDCLAFVILPPEELISGGSSRKRISALKGSSAPCGTAVLLKLASPTSSSR